MLQKSHLTGRPYNEDDVIFFRNPVQSAYYFLNGATLVDLIVTEELKFIFIFNKRDHERLKLNWKYRKNNRTEFYDKK